MNRTFIFLLLLIALTARAQQPAYPEFEVQQPAEPKGGLAALNQFMAVNLRKPFMAQVANLKGLVILRGVVEPNGRIAEVTVARSLRPDCDREAVRVFSLFNAWKPAQKDGKAVRQVVTYPIKFGANELVEYKNGIAVRYYNKAFQLVASPDSAVLRSEMPADTLGLPTGNLVFFNRKGDKWKKEAEMLYVRKPALSQQPGNKTQFTIGHYDDNARPFGQIYTIDSQGIVYDESFYDLDRKLVLLVFRNNNQLITRREIYNDNKAIVTSWYDNGQVKGKQIRAHNQMTNTSLTPPQMLAYWDSTGSQLVNEGNGQLRTTERVESMVNPNQHTILTEQGLYEKGLKQGRWTGEHADGSYWYEEQYEKGLLQLGKTIYTGRTDTLQYTIEEQQPEFLGGMKGLSQFLAQTMRYPAEAQKSRVQGRVFVSFVINTDGNVGDVNVLKGIGFGCDEESVRVVKLTSGHWKPGIQRGRPVRVKYNIPLNFALQ